MLFYACPVASEERRKGKQTQHTGSGRGKNFILDCSMHTKGRAEGKRRKKDSTREAIRDERRSQ